MAFNGFALGGAAEGYLNAEKTDIAQQQVTNTAQYQQGVLKLQQQAQDNAQHRDLLTRADKSRGDMWNLVAETVKQMKARGADDLKISKAVQPLIQPLKRLTQSSGLDSSTIDAQLAALLAQPGLDLGSIAPDARSVPTTAATASSVPATSPIAGSAGGGMSNLTSSDTLGQPTDVPAATNPQDEVNRLTRAIIMLPPGSENARAALQLRLQDAMKRSNTDLEFKTVTGPNFEQSAVTFNPRTGEVKPVQGLPEGSGGSAAEDIAQGIKDGTQPPVTQGLYRQGAAVRAILAKDKFNLLQAQIEWDRAHRQIAALNGPQMIKYAGLAQSVVATIDEVRDLSREMGNSGVPLANRAKLQAYIQTEGNSEKGQLATRYLTAVNTLKEEFTNLAQGGYAPTESAWALANSQINADYGYKQMEASLTEVRRLIQYRLRAIPNFQTLGPGAANRYGGGATQQPGLSGQTSGGISWSAQ